MRRLGIGTPETDDDHGFSFAIVGLSYIPPYRRKESIAASALGEEVYYWFTTQGGARWEAVFCPDCNRYVYAATGLDEGETIASDRKAVEQYEYFGRYTSNIPIIAFRGVGCAGAVASNLLENSSHSSPVTLSLYIRRGAGAGLIPPLAKQF